MFSTSLLFTIFRGQLQLFITKRHRWRKLMSGTNVFRHADQIKFWTGIEDKTEGLSSLKKFMQIRTQTEVKSKN